nr:DUF2169 domain-containing protein [Methylobacterium sp. OTU13CASTA1]
MQLVNRTAFSAFAFRQFDQNGDLDCVVSVRGTFRFEPGGTLAVADRQEPFQWEDVYDGEPQQGSLLRQGDLVPYKPGTDVTLLGDAVNPNPDGGPFVCRIRIGNQIDASLRVMGPRRWQARTRRTWRGLLQRDPQPVLEGWDLSGPEPAARVPLTWASAVGGTLPGATGEVHPDNPLGLGLVDRAHCDHRETYPAPTIEAVDAPVERWNALPAPAGFGPLPPWWRPRQRYAGTYDEAWLAERHPLLPRDFDPRFWQCAPTGLVATPWLAGTEAFTLDNLHPDAPHLTGGLPGIMLGVTARDERATTKHPLVLDGVQFDLRAGRDAVLLTWRCRFPLPEAERAEIVLAERARLRRKQPDEEVAA